MRRPRRGVAFQAIRAKCPFCKAGAALIIRRHPPASIARTVVLCSGCGLLRAEPLPDFPAWREWMRALDTPECGALEQRPLRRVERDAHAAFSRVRRLHPFLFAGAQVLYAGPGGREFALLMNRAGGQVSCVKLEECLAAGLRPGLSARAADDGSTGPKLPPGRWDCITIVDGLARAPDPVALLAGLEAILQKNGTLAIETENLESPCSGPEAPVSSEVLFRFNAATLERCAHLAGLRPLALTPFAGQTALWGVFTRAERGAKDRSGMPENVERLLARERRLALADQPGWFAALAGRMARWWSSALERFALRGPRDPEAILEALAAQVPVLKAAEPLRRSASLGSG